MSKREKKPRTPTAEDLAKAAQLEKLIPPANSMEPPLPFELSAHIRHLDGVTLRTREYLSGMPRIDMHPLQSLFLAATDLHGNGYAEEILGLLIHGAKAWDDPERLDVALRCIASAYSKPRLSHRKFMQERDEANTRNNP